MDILNDFLSANASLVVGYITVFITSLGVAIAFAKLAHQTPANKKVIIAIISVPTIILSIPAVVYFNIWDSPDNIYTRSTSGSLTMTSSLSQQDAYNWQVNNDSSSKCIFTGEAYQVTSLQRDHITYCFARGTFFTNFAFQAEMAIQSGDAGGLIFRANEAPDLYGFTVHANGFYELYVSENSLTKSNQTLSSGNVSFNPSQYNLLTVIVHGSHIYLYMDTHFLTSVSDSTFDIGEIGVFAYDVTKPTEVAFSNAQVWKL